MERVTIVNNGTDTFKKVLVDQSGFITSEQAGELKSALPDLPLVVRAWGGRYKTTLAKLDDTMAMVSAKDNIRDVFVPVGPCEEFKRVLGYA